MIAYLGLGLTLCALHPLIGLAAPWLWLVVALTAGYAVEPGEAPTLRSWAYPLQPSDWHPELAVGLLALGALTFVLRPPSAPP